MTTSDQRDLPKPVFTDAEAGAKVFPDSTARRFNYYHPAKRKQTHYEDVTVEVQPDPRHYLSQGWLYGFSDGRGGYPLRSEEHTSELQSRSDLVCRLLLEKKK